MVCGILGSEGSVNSAVRSHVVLFVKSCASGIGIGWRLFCILLPAAKLFWCSVYFCGVELN